MLKLYTKAQIYLQSLQDDESGQDLVEYAIVAAVVVALAISLGKGTLTTAITSAVTKLSDAIGKLT